MKKILSAVCAVLMAFSAGVSLSTPVKAAETGIMNEAVQNQINEVAALVNQERAAQGLSALKIVPALNQAAEIRAEEIKTNFSHTRPNGQSCATVLTETGISWRTTGENIAYGYATPADVMNGWMHSDGHRANILNPDFDSIGIGVADQNGVLYWTQVFTGGTNGTSGESVTDQDCPGGNCDDGFSAIRQDCSGGNCNDVLSIINQNCSGGNCNDVLSIINQNCSGGNCNDVLSMICQNCQ